MGFNCGIVGLPNVGKSTLFNALLGRQQAQAANYPFCTIEPNIGKVEVPDIRLDKIAEIIKPEKILHTQTEFVDIAGLIAGASKGEGLGNKFLGAIREVDAIIHVLRCFGGDAVHVEGSPSPIRDAEIVETELLLADLENIQKRRLANEKKLKSGDKLSVLLDALLKKLEKLLAEGKKASEYKQEDTEKLLFKELGLITAKPCLYVLNIDEESISEGNELSKAAIEEFGKEKCIIISAAMEEQLSVLSSEDKSEYLQTMGIAASGLDSLIKAGYDLLGLSVYFTAGEKEARAWTINAGATAPQAAGVIHGDFEKGFIRAETIAYEDYIKYNGEQGAKDAGKLRQEGKDYIVVDGDVIHFKFNV